MVTHLQVALRRDRASGLKLMRMPISIFYAFIIMVNFLKNITFILICFVIKPHYSYEKGMKKVPYLASDAERREGDVELGDRCPGPVGTDQFS